MTDTLTPAQRSWNMSRIRSRDTSPEKTVRSLLHRLGFRFRLHAKKLPGHPDIVLARHRTVVFVHGCFWHRHPRCRFATTPGTRTAFWQTKFDRNVARDAAVRRALKAAGWRVITVWECELRKPARLTARLRRLLRPPQACPGAAPIRLLAAEAPAPYRTRRRSRQR
jgi:DNA mismatch endonuclease (patch repair protein)